MPEALVVDFGTTNTVVAEWTDDGPATVRLDRLSRTPDSGMPPVIPSLLYVEDARRGRVLAGQEVIAAGQDNKTDPRFFAAFKRALAAEYREPARQLDGVAVSYEQAGAWFLAKVLQAVRGTGRRTDEVLFTLPVRSFETYAKWLSAVSQGLGVQQMHILDESTAAALGYEVDRSRVPVLVFDFGGGTLDVSAIRTPDLAAQQVGFLVRLGRLFGGSKEEQEQIQEGTATVLGKSCEVLGGEDIDLWIGDAVLQGYGKTRTDVSMVDRQFKNSAESVKIALSTGTTTAFSCFDTATAQIYNRDYSRSDLEEILDRHGFFTTMQQCVDSALRQAELEGIRREDLRHVALTGGSSQIPSVQRAMRQLFGDRVQSHKPFEAVAHGALRATRGIKVEDFLYHSYGIEGWNGSHVDPVTKDRGAFQYDVVFYAGERYPTGEVERRYPCAERNQEAIDLTVGEIDYGVERTGEVVFEQGQLRLQRSQPAVTSGRRYNLVGADQVTPVNPTPLEVQLDPPGQPGPDRIRCLFHVDGDRALRVSVYDLRNAAGGSGKLLLRDAKLADVR